MKRKIINILSIALAAALVFLCASCSDNSVINNTSTSTPKVTATPDINGDIVFEETEHFSVFDQKYTYDESTAVYVDVSLGSVTITDPGTYILSGTLNDGQITVNVAKEEKVQLVLNNVSVTSSASAALFVLSADKVSLTLPEGTVNSFTDATEYALDDEAKGCIYSKDDLSINGFGTLNVTGQFNNGISVKNDLRICGGKINVSAVNNAIKGNDSVGIMGGTITVKSAEDAIKADSVDFGEGFVYIIGGDFDITCSDDAIQASQDVTVTGGTFIIKCGGKKVNSKGTSELNGIIK